MLHLRRNVVNTLNKRHPWMPTSNSRQQSIGSVDLTILFVRTISIFNFLWHERQYMPLVWVTDDGLQYFMGILNGSIALSLS